MSAKGAGELRHRGTLQSDSGGGRDGLGEGVENWQDVATVHFKLEPLTGREYWLAAQVQSDVTHKITLRYRTGVTSRQRIVFGSRTFHFLEKPRDLEERHEWLEVNVKEVEAARTDE